MNVHFYEQSLEIQRQIGDRRGEATSLNNLGSAYVSLGEYQRAIAFHQQSLEIFRQIGDRYSQASTYHQLGNVALELREYQQAQAHYQQALEIFVECRDKHNGGIALRSFARLHQATQDDGILTDVARFLNTPVERMKKFFRTLNLKSF